MVRVMVKVRFRVKLRVSVMVRFRVWDCVSFRFIVKVRVRVV